MIFLARQLRIPTLDEVKDERRSPTSLLEKTKTIQADANRGKCWVSGVLTLFLVPCPCRVPLTGSSEIEVIFVSPIMYRLRNKVIDIDEEQIKIVVHHSGHFVNDDNGDFKFDGEIAEWCCDVDLLSYLGIVASVKELGHMHIKELWLELLTDDKGVMHMLNITRLNDEVHLYMVHNMVEPQIIEMIDWVGGQADDEGVEDAEVHKESDAQEGHGVDAEVHTEGHAEEGGEVNVEDGEVQVEDVDVQVKDGDVHVEDADVQVEDADVQVEENNEVHQVEVGEVQVEDAEDQVRDDEVHEVEDLGEDDDVEDSEGEEVDESEGKEVHESESEEVHESESKEEDLHDVTVQCDIGTSKGNVREEHSSPLLESSQSTNNEKNMHDVRGLFDNEWLSEELISEGESEDDDGSSKTKFPTFNMPRSLEGYKWEVGTFFAEKMEFIDAIRTYALRNGRNLKFIKNDKKMIYVKCLGGKGTCKWYAYCAFRIDVNAWQLRKQLGKEQCIYIPCPRGEITYQSEKRNQLVQSKALDVADAWAPAKRTCNGGISVEAREKAEKGNWFFF
ncbi:hypothetical protein V8G54_035463 [Vigna mungo]|uniref:Transposase MuDR plant domain-containing protein n=1 Tax=Vigna mungo TaxID=3915 RepID=A0AAQ3MF16_VIGMU